MSRAGHIAEGIIVCLLYVLVFDDKAKRTAQRAPVLHAGDTLNLVVFFPGSGDARLARSPTVELMLHQLKIKFKVTGKAFDQASRDWMWGKIPAEWDYPKVNTL